MQTDVVFDGGSEVERRRLLELHQIYLDANAKLDTELLSTVWRDDPSAVYFNLNGHTYVGLNQWKRLWRHYKTQFETVEPWVPTHVKVLIRGDMAVITCERTCRLRWIGDEPPASFSDKPLPSRSTQVYVRENGDWRVVHAHFSPANEGPRPGSI
jgi:hypothetical protein